MASTWIVVPCFNEATRLDSRAFVRYASGAADIRLLFVDDGSTDDTARVLERLCAKRPERMARLVLPSNRGKGEAVRAGMTHAIAMGAAYAGYWDADLSTPLDAVHRFIRVLDDMPWLELVMGSRVQLLGRRIERRPLRHYFGRGFATAASLTLGLSVYDTQCGAKLFRVTPGVGAVFARPFVSRWAFDVEILARMVRQRNGTGLRPVEEVIREEPLVEWRDVGGSKLTPRAWVRAGIDLLHIANAMHGTDRQLDGPAVVGADRPVHGPPACGSSQLWDAELYGLHAEAELLHWWFRARRRILTRIARRILGDARARVVDVGCGTGGNIAALATSYSCTGIDPSADAIRLAHQRHPNVEFLVGRAPADLPVRDRDADLFMITDVLEHVEEDRGLLAAMLDCARPGAHFIVTVPADVSLWSHHDVRLGHHRRYDEARLGRLWVGLPVTVRLLSHFSARLYPAIKTARLLGRHRGRAVGAGGTDIAVPYRPFNAVLEHVFAGEGGRLIAALDRGRLAYRRGSSLIAVLRREDTARTMT